MTEVLEPKTAELTGYNDGGWHLDIAMESAGVPVQAADPLNAVRLAAAWLETVQWELDCAQQMLAEAARKAVRLGAEPGSLCEAAGMDIAELKVLL